MKPLPLALAVFLGVLLGAGIYDRNDPAPIAPAPALDEDRPVVEEILAQALGSGRAHAMLAELTRVAPHRLSGSEGAERAVDWAVGTMLELGLENVRREECTVPYWVRGEVERLEYVAPRSRAGEAVPLLALGGSVPTARGGVRGEVMAVGTFEELEARADEAYGKIVLFARPMDDTLADTFEAYHDAVAQRTRGAQEAARVGAVAALVRSMSTRRDDAPHTGGMDYDDAPRIPTAAISTNAADEIVALLADGETVELELELDCEDRGERLSANVVGEIVGRELPHEILVVGGHLDGWDVGEGAHDDGAGSVQSLEAARLLLALGLEPRRTIRVVLYMNEENGRAGAFAYRAAHVAELGDHVLALESDRGGFAPRGFRTDAVGESRDVLASAVALLDGVGADGLWEGSGGADVGVLAEDGVVTIGLRPDPQRYFDFHHSKNDVLEAVHPRELELGAACMASLLWVVAEREERLPPNPIPEQDED